MDKHIGKIYGIIEGYNPVISKTCLWNNCNLYPVKSHSHSKLHLKNISNKNKIYQFNGSFLRQTKGCFFKLTGINQASTFKGFCKNHDNILFAAIEKNCSIPYNEENMFLIFARSIFFEYHQKILAKKKVIQLKKIFEKQNITYNENYFDRYIKAKNEAINKDLQSYLNEIYTIYNKKIYNEIMSIYIKLSKKAPISVTTVICPFFNNFTTSIEYNYNDIQPMFSFNIIPEESGSLVVISWLKKDNPHMKCITNTANHDLNKLLNYLVFMETENYYFSPYFYNECIEPESEYIVKSIYNRSNGMSFDDTKVIYNFIDKDTKITFNIN